jgi:hypothetical protein
MAAGVARAADVDADAVDAAAGIAAVEINSVRAGVLFGALWYG